MIARNGVTRSSSLVIESANLGNNDATALVRPLRALDRKTISPRSAAQAILGRWLEAS
jgi:hypothetical protein